MISVEHKTFATRNDFFIFVMNNFKGKDEEKLEMIHHEDDHYYKAIRLGYSPKYGTGLLSFLRFIKIDYAFINVGFPLNKEGMEDFLEISKSPEKLSIIDKCCFPYFKFLLLKDQLSQYLKSFAKNHPNL